MSTGAWFDDDEQFMCFLFEEHVNKTAEDDTEFVVTIGHARRDLITKRVGEDEVLRDLLRLSHEEDLASRGQAKSSSTTSSWYVERKGQV